MMSHCGHSCRSVKDRTRTRTEVWLDYYKRIQQVNDKVVRGGVERSSFASSGFMLARRPRTIVMMMMVEVVLVRHVMRRDSYDGDCLFSASHPSRPVSCVVTRRARPPMIQDGEDDCDGSTPEVFRQPTHGI